MLKYNFIAKYKSILHNFFYLIVLRIFNILTKFLLVAFLVRTLGEKIFGLLTWSESILQYFIILINFGFNIFGAKYIVKFKENKVILNNIISVIYGIKLCLLFISFLLLFVIYRAQILEADFILMFLLLISTIGDLLYPIWYFQGIEKLKPLTKVVAFVKALLLILTVVFIKSSLDLYLYVTFFTISQVLIGVLSFNVLKKYTSFKFLVPKKKIIFFLLSKAKLYFLGNLSMLVFNALTLFLIGIYVSMEKVTGFDISLKITMFFLLPFEILQVVILPVITGNKDKKMLQQLLFFSILSGIIICLGIQFFSEELLLLFGGLEMTKYTYILNNLSFITLTVPTTFILQGIFIALEKDKAYNYSLMIVALIYVIIIMSLIFYKQVKFDNFLYLRIFLDYLLFSILISYAYKKKILSK